MGKTDLALLQLPDAPKITGKVPGPKSLEILERQRKFEGNIVSYSRDIPVAFVKGSGATLEDVDGNRFIDFFGGAAVVGAGHSNPKILEAVQEQEGRLIHSLDLATETRERLSERLVHLAPGNLKDNAKVVFGGPTGSDAVESAIKLAKVNTGRHVMIAFDGSYHGMTGNALSVTADSGFKAPYMPMGTQVHFMPYSYCYRCPISLKYPKCEIRCAGYLDHVLGDPSSGVLDAAGIIMEPVQGEGGTIVPPDGFTSEIRRIADFHQIPLIIDEVQAGLGRTGKLFASEHSGISPDIMTVSKALGGGIGFPLSGLVYRKDYDKWTPGSHIGTFRGFLPAMAGGLAYLDFVEENNILDHVTELGKRMLMRLQEFEDQSSIVGEARGLGLMLGFELVYDKKTKKPAPELAAKLREEAVKRGVIIEVGGHYHNVARILPPLVLTKELADRGLDIMEESLRAVEGSL